MSDQPIAESALMSFTEIQQVIGEWATANFDNNESRPLTKYNTRNNAYYNKLERGWDVELTANPRKGDTLFPLMGLGSLAPLMGIGEEIGELIEAQASNDDKSLLDALGDIGIYMMDYTYREQIPGIGVLFDAMNYQQFPYSGLIINYGKLLHITLKHHQGIRGYNNIEYYQARRNIHLLELISCCKHIAALNNTNWLTIINHTWVKVVARRDWKLAPKDGGGVTHVNATDPPQFSNG